MNVTTNALVSKQPVTNVVAINTGTDTVPPYSVLQVVSVDTDGYFSVQAPLSSGLVNGLLFTGAAPIFPGAKGQACIASPIPLAFSRDNFGGVGPVSGESWGVRAGSYVLHKGFSGFLAVNDAEDSDGIALFMPTTSRPVEIVRITSSVKVDGRYPAKRCSFDPVNGTLADIEDVWFVDLNE